MTPLAEIRGCGIPRTAHSIIGTQKSGRISTLVRRRLVELFPFNEDYLRRLIAGEPAVVSHFIRYMRKILTPMLRNRHVEAAVIDEIIQETFARFWQKLRSSERPVRKAESLGAYVCNMAKNIFKEEGRDRFRYPQLPDDYDRPADDDPYAQAVSRQQCERVRLKLLDMPARDAKLLIAIWIDGRPRAEVCKELNVDQNYLRVLIHRANQEFRKRWDDDDNDS